MNFKETCEAYLLELYSDTNSFNMDGEDKALWLWCKIHRAIPKYACMDGKVISIKSSDLHINTDYTFRTIADKYADECFSINKYRILHPKFSIASDGDIWVTDDSVFKEYIEPNLIFVERNKSFNYVAYSNSGIRSYTMEIKDLNTDETFFDNYNDDLPWDKLKYFCEGNESGIIVLHGPAGTGKTSIIRHLISSCETLFYWLEPSMFSQISNADFLRYLAENGDSVFVLEDCEALLQDRNLGGNGLISSLLNIADGILGDSLNIKFICTFNTDLRNIDKALLRKGRLKLKYEVKELETDKANKLFSKLNIEHTTNKPMPLCEIYKFSEDNGTKSNVKKIGF